MSGYEVAVYIAAYGISFLTLGFVVMSCTREQYKGKRR